MALSYELSLGSWPFGDNTSSKEASLAIPYTAFPGAFAAVPANVFEPRIVSIGVRGSASITVQNWRFRLAAPSNPAYYSELVDDLENSSALFILTATFNNGNKQTVIVPGPGNAKSAHVGSVASPYRWNQAAGQTWQTELNTWINNCLREVTANRPPSVSLIITDNLIRPEAELTVPAPKISASPRVINGIQVNLPVPAPKLSFSARITPPDSVQPKSEFTIPVPGITVSGRVRQPAGVDVASKFAIPVPVIDKAQPRNIPPLDVNPRANLSVPAPKITATPDTTQPADVKPTAVLPITVKITVQPKVANPIRPKAEWTIPAPDISATARILEGAQAHFTIPAPVIHPGVRVVNPEAIRPTAKWTIPLEISAKANIVQPSDVKPEAKWTIPAPDITQGVEVLNPVWPSAMLTIPTPKVSVYYRVGNPIKPRAKLTIPSVLFTHAAANIRQAGLEVQSIPSIGRIPRTRQMEVGRLRRVNALRRRMPYRMVVHYDPLLLDERLVQDDDPNDRQVLYNYLVNAWYQNQGHEIRCDFNRQINPSRTGGVQPTDEPSHRVGIIVPGEIPEEIRVTDIATILELHEQPLYTIIHIGHDRLRYITNITLEEYGHRSLAIAG